MLIEPVSTTSTKNLFARDLLPQSEFKFLRPENRSKAPLAKNKLWQIPQKRLNKGSKFDFFSPKKKLIASFGSEIENKRSHQERERERESSEPVKVIERVHQRESEREERE